MNGWTDKRHPWRKAVFRVRHAAEGLLFAVLMGIFWLLPVDWASGLAGALSRGVGPHLALSRRAERHLRLAFPDIGAAETARIVTAMWDNLGRMIAEYPHLGAIADPASGRLEVVGAERLDAVRRAGRPFIVISAHMANFELMPIAAYKKGHNLTVVSRPVNNPVIQRILLYFRERPTGNWGRIPKGVEGARQAVLVMNEGQNLGILVDQRTSQGVALPLFGHPARTTLGAAKLAIEYGVDLFPAHLERLGGVRFRLTVEEPVRRPQLGDKQAEARAMMTEVNRVLERWIRRRPEDWLWLHRRWDRP